MSFIYKKYIWPIEDPEAIAHEQNVLAGGSVVLNGNFISAGTPGQISLIDHEVVRGISITSANNLTGSTFTINGTQNGAIVTENLVGPAANNAVYSTKSYDVITSITVDNASNGVRVGTGNIGYIPLMAVNMWALNSIINYGVQIIPADVTCELFYTLDTVYNNAISFDDCLNPVPASADIFHSIQDNITDGYVYRNNEIVKYLLLKVETDVATAKVTVIYMQV